MTSGRSPRGAGNRQQGAGGTRLAYSTAGETPPPEPPAGPRPARGAGPVRLRLERRASGRVVTLLTGLPGTRAEVAALAGELRSACGAGGTARAEVVELQGDQREKAAAVLAARGLRVKR